MKLTLGTVQFGLDYGVSNQQGQVAKREVQNILNQAQALGIDTLDCAGAYGNSEKILGGLGAGKHFNLITKIPDIAEHINSTLPFLERSLQNLKINRLSSLLFHQADNLLKHPHRNKLFSELTLLKKQQIISNVGVSVYSPEQLSSITRQFDIDIVQAPINVFDQRFITADILSHCHKNKIKIHARSVFLQGLLLMQTEQTPMYFKKYKNKINKFSDLSKKLFCSRLTLAFAILAQNSHNKGLGANEIKTQVIEKIVVGVCNTQQLHEIVEAYYQAQNLHVAPEELNALLDTRAGLINPSLWQLESS